MNDRIKLAEAMGLIISHDAALMLEAVKNNSHFDLRGIPDPENDASDDYAVLEWARQSAADECGLLPSGKPRWASSDKWWPFYEALNTKPHRAEMYQIGDYARAALKVIE